MPESHFANILERPEFTLAVTSINRRAESQSDISKLIDVFVETDLPIRCETTDHQLILGRRGTGKTHLLRYFQHRKQTQGGVVYYSDCRSLGSGFPSAASDPITTASKYFVALLNEFGTVLLDHLIRLEKPDPGVQERIWSTLSEGLATFLKPTEGRVDSVFNYRQISDSIRVVLEGLEIDRLFLVLDEWAQIPVTVQPYVAEFIKRTFLVVPYISVKVLAVNYQCKFSEQVAGNLIGMQRGADFTDVIDIDGHLVFDEKRQPVVEFFGQLLYNHLGAELGWDLSLDKASKLLAIQQLFTQEPAFIELVRAAEGNCRDFICIFSKAYLDGYRQNQSSKAISIPQICSAAAQWYTNEKESNIRTEAEAQRTISYLLDEVLRGYESRTFLVEVRHGDHPILIRLLNERVLHKLNATYSHPDRPGLRYEIYTLDYGAYVQYRGTVNEPGQDIFVNNESVAMIREEERRSIVPFDDKRSIRRIVFDPDAVQIEAG